MKMIELPYALDALEPYYNKETLEIHYATLYKGYVDNTNKTEEKLAKARLESDYTNIKAYERDLAFYGSGAILHELFFTNMKKPSTMQITENLLQQIVTDFGGMNRFQEQFAEAAKAVEASGWCILAWVPRMNGLKILQCEKHQNLTLWGCIPILVLDMWEHSYFLQYKANRASYIEAFQNIIDWNMVNKRFQRIIEK